MHLTKYSDYALRTLIYLAAKQANPATIKEIADRFNISRNHLVKVVHQLSTAGLVHSERGRNGGIRLGRLPSEINIGSVVRLTEDHMDIAECFNPSKNACVISGNCRLQGALRRALAAFLAELDGFTLADFTNDN